MSKEKFERRAFAFDNLKIETRAGKDDKDARVLTGHAAVFNRWSEDLGGFREQIKHGAFDSVLSNDVRSLFNHDMNIVLGRTKSGTLRLSVDATGLHIENELPDTQLVRDMVVTPIERGDVSQMSFAFRVEREGDEWERDGDMYKRTISRIARLYDVSPVTFAAYPQTDLALRSMQSFIDEQTRSAEATRAALQRASEQEQAAKSEDFKARASRRLRLAKHAD